MREVIIGDSIPHRHFVHAVIDFADELSTDTSQALASSSANSLAIFSIVEGVTNRNLERNKLHVKRISS
jgi:hypothetical protein